jgi:hypothetical protein
MVYKTKNQKVKKEVVNCITNHNNIYKSNCLKVRIDVTIQASARTVDVTIQASTKTDDVIIQVSTRSDDVTDKCQQNFFLSDVM